MEILKVLVWPIAVIIIVVIVVLLLKTSIQDILTRITKLRYGETVAEVSQVRQETNEKSLVAQNQNDKPNENIEKALGIFSNPTLNRAKHIVESESKVNELTDTNKKIETLIKYSEALYLFLTFEKLYNNIFGSQLYILDFINTNNSETKIDLKIFYEKAKERYIDFYEAYSYEEYFNFLINHELMIVKEDDTCEITWLGRDFLKYLIEKGKTINKRF